MRTALPKKIYGPVSDVRAAVVVRPLLATPDQVLKKLKLYMDLGIEAFILSGYPHQQECDLFARYVLPELEHGVLT